MAPKGIVTDQTWLRISRWLDNVDGVYKNVASRLGICEKGWSRIPSF